MCSWSRNSEDVRRVSLHIHGKYLLDSDKVEQRQPASQQATLPTGHTHRAESFLCTVRVWPCYLLFIHCLYCNQIKQSHMINKTESTNNVKHVSLRFRLPHAVQSRSRVSHLLQECGRCERPLHCLPSAHAHTYTAQEHKPTNPRRSLIPLIKAVLSLSALQHNCVDSSITRSLCCWGSTCCSWQPIKQTPVWVQPCYREPCREARENCGFTDVTQAELLLGYMLRCLHLNLMNRSQYPVWRIQNKTLAHTVPS